MGPSNPGLSPVARWLARGAFVLWCLALSLSLPTHAVEVAIAIIIRGIALHRPITRTRLLVAAGFLAVEAVAVTIHPSWHGGLGSIAGAVALSLPTRPPRPATPGERIEAQGLVDGTRGDALAPFVLRTDKALLFSPARGAVVGYRVKFGIMAIGGDPVGDPGQFDEVMAASFALARANGWRVAVLGAGPAAVESWRGYGLRPVVIGRDVVLDAAEFEMVGRPFRNLRQAVARADRAMSTLVVEEENLDPGLRAELIDLVGHTGRDSKRGFSMILDGLLEGSQRHTLVAVGHDLDGNVMAFQRYAIAGGGTDLSLDLPWRDQSFSLSGVDERLVIAVLEYAREHGGERVSLAFAAFPDIFTDHSGALRSLAYRSVRLLDPLIRLESLYRYLAKYRSFGDTRAVVLRPLAVVPVAAAFLWLEFSGQ